MKQFLRFLLIVVVLIVGFLLIQFIPYAKDLSNPPVVSEPNWPTSEVKDLAMRACYDCHSNETVWPWYSRIAPVSWMVYRDVIKGRRVINFSDWQSYPINESDELTNVIVEGEMPPLQYLLMHPSSRLSPAEKEQLLNGLKLIVAK